MFSQKLNMTNQDGYGQDVSHAEAAVGDGYVDACMGEAVILVEVIFSWMTRPLPVMTKKEFRETMHGGSHGKLAGNILNFEPNAVSARCSKLDSLWSDGFRE